MENKVNELSGKEWLKNAINFWQIESNELEPLFLRFKSFCFKKRTTGLCCKKIGNDIPPEDKYDFGFYKVDNYLDSQECAYIAAKSSYDSYHVFFLDKEIDKKVLLTDYVYKLCIEYGMEYRGKIVCWNKNDNSFSYCLMFLNRIQSNDICKLSLTPFEVTANLEEPYVIESKSKMDSIGLKHPAPFSYIDIKEICTKNGISNKVVLDPFLGVGSTIIGCFENNKCIGIELNKEYVDLTYQRYELLNLPSKIRDNIIICGDSFAEVPKIENFDIVITSPPYFNILKNKTTGVRSDGSQSRQGIEYYSEDNKDVGNISEYSAYLESIKSIFKECFKKTNNDGEFYLVISDFTVNKKEKDVHSDMIRLMNEIGYHYCGTSYIRQNQKVIYPFGYPFKIVLNHIFQYVIKFKKYE